MSEPWTEWEPIANRDDTHETHRLRVPGGWLVRSTVTRWLTADPGDLSCEPVATALVFVPEAPAAPTRLTFAEHIARITKHGEQCARCSFDAHVNDEDPRRVDLRPRGLDRSIVLCPAAESMLSEASAASLEGR